MTPLVNIMPFNVAIAILIESTCFWLLGDWLQFAYMFMRDTMLKEIRHILALVCLDDQVAHPAKYWKAEFAVEMHNL